MTPNKYSVKNGLEPEKNNVNFTYLNSECIMAAINLKAFIESGLILENQNEKWDPETRLDVLREISSHLRCYQVYAEMQKKLFRSVDLDWMVLDKSYDKSEKDAHLVKIRTKDNEQEIVEIKSDDSETKNEKWDAETRLRIQKDLTRKLKTLLYNQEFQMNLMTSVWKNLLVLVNQNIFVTNSIQFKNAANEELEKTNFQKSEETNICRDEKAFDKQAKKASSVISTVDNFCKNENEVNKQAKKSNSKRSVEVRLCKSKNTVKIEAKKGNFDKFSKLITDKSRELPRKIISFQKIEVVPKSKIIKNFKLKCYRCNKTGHWANKCPALKEGLWFCYKCKKMAQHRGVYCPKKRNDIIGNNVVSFKENRRRARAKLSIIEEKREAQKEKQSSPKNLEVAA